MTSAETPVAETTPAVPSMFGEDGMALDFDSFRKSVKGTPTDVQVAMLNTALEQMVRTTKNALYLQKTLSNIYKRKSLKGTRKGNATAIKRRFKIEDWVLKLLNSTEEAVSRPELTKLISEYANKHDLKKKEDRRWTVLDDNLAKIMQGTAGEEVQFVHFSGRTKHLFEGKTAEPDPEPVAA